MIDNNISIHDKHQFEIKLEYKFKRDKRYSLYQTEMYIFMPNSLGINPHTYSKDNFYSDLQVYIRFKTPTVLLENIAGVNNGSLSKLKQSCLKMVQEGTTELKIIEYERHIKMFCCIFKSAIRDHVKYTCEKEINTDVEDLVNKYIRFVKKVLSGYRDLRSIINVPIISQEVFSKYLFGDEYISLLVENYTFSLLEEIKKKKIVGEQRMIDSLLALIKDEIKWRREHKYDSIPDKNSDNEVFIFRNSVLKKYMSSVLFLNTRLEQEGGIKEQIIYGIAAGVAMFFATGVAFYSQYVFGSLTFPLFVTLVVSYIFKDRIKEILRIFLKNELKAFFPDFNKKIYADRRNKIGICREFLEFSNDKDIEKEILKLRDRDHITEIENGWMGERVIYYKKQVKLFSNNLDQVYCGYQIDGINDIMRFNVMKFQSKMDNPRKSFFVINESCYNKIEADRVYHLNLVIKYKMDDEEIIYKRFRIVLNKEGIKQIDHFFT